VRVGINLKKRPADPTGGHDAGRVQVGVVMLGRRADRTGDRFLANRVPAAAVRKELEPSGPSKPRFGINPHSPTTLAKRRPPGPGKLQAENPCVPTSR
jgi:hypothetical protein